MARFVGDLKFEVLKTSVVTFS